MRRFSRVMVWFREGKGRGGRRGEEELLRGCHRGIGGGEVGMCFLFYLFFSC